MTEMIKFQTFMQADAEPDKYIERIARALGSYAGILDFDFESEIDDDCSGTIADLWDTGGATGTWTYTSGQLKGTSGAGWKYILSDDDMPRNFVIQFYMDCDKGQFVWRAQDMDNFYILRWGDSEVQFLKRVGGTNTQLIVLPYTYNGPGIVELSARDEWMSVWFDGEFVMSFWDDSLEDAGKIGFGAHADENAFYDDIRIPELTHHVDYSSLGVGETPADAMARAVGQRHIKYWMRYDGSLRMVRPQTLTNTFTYQNVSNPSWDRDQRLLWSHVRVVGAWDWADYYNSGLLDEIGHVFVKIDNPDLMTVDECLEEAEFQSKLSEALSNRVSFGGLAMCLQEREDRIQLEHGQVDEYYRVSSLTLEFSVAEFEISIQGRKYVA